MNSSRPFEFVSIVLIVSCLSSISYGQGLLAYDGAFSPNGAQIAVGTSEGLHLFDRSSREQTFFRPVENGVRFLKWAPDGKRVMWVSWKENETPTYTLFDLERNQTVCSFQEEARWYYYHIFYSEPHEDGSERLEESIYPVSIELGHPANAVFSPDGSEIAFLTWSGIIQIRSAETGEILRSFDMSAHHLVSLGYSADGRELWAGADTEESPLWFIDAHNGQVLRTINIKVKGVLGHIFYYRSVIVIEVRSDGKFALSIPVLQDLGPPEYPLPSGILLVDLTKEQIALSKGEVFYGAFFRNRGTYGNTNSILMLLNYIEMDILFRNYNPETGSLGDKELMLFPDIYPYSNHTSPAQPFPEDGNEVLVINEGRLFVADSRTAAYDILYPPVAAVRKAEIHEFIPEPQGEHR